MPIIDTDVHESSSGLQDHVPYLCCPRHGVESSLENGWSVVADGHGRSLKLRPYDVQTDGGDVIVVT